MTNTMTYRGYVASMTFDAEDKIIVGRVLDVDDIISFHGESILEFEANFHAVVDDYIAACESLGSEPEKPASGTSLNKWAEEASGAASRRSAGARAQRAKSNPSPKQTRSGLRSGRAA
ncbi:MAG: type II toxin-antitoxin system HicB family antitoxin [Burkholderiales bacterium]|nr:type II toxin-antitoxin system HicB family antitoxin [Burkholderiales bacterium]HMM52247.1 type II toxin-antitoxin system HicB family antitoxin [Burkholderiaceae bacterium]